MQTYLMLGTLLLVECHSDNPLEQNAVPTEIKSCMAVKAVLALEAIMTMKCPWVDDELCVLGYPFDLIPSIHKFHCTTGGEENGGALGALGQDRVHVLNATAFLDLLQRHWALLEEERRLKGSVPRRPVCMLVDFYGPHCPFSARTAPIINALPRLVAGLRVVAVDATVYTKLNSRYGVTGTPSLILWHDGKAVARYDDIQYSLDGVIQFLRRWTDLPAQSDGQVTAADYLGPLIIEGNEGRPDYYLVAAWLFVLACLVYYSSRTSVALRLVETLRTNFRDANE